ncbi:unnamed protein product [Brachionus calyciflorus]|uniref:Small integral membrane protein 14 n=1 Tax=Brachionus calyciflorus TaxID=104777 RepID=A0A814KMZ5_9BILA|nr:unnamed protein product [Brachionus calyciflorus]
MSGDNYDFCEYVYNPLMRQYQAMIRLMQMLGDGNSQSECNDIQCFTNPNDLTNPMTSLNNVNSNTSFTTYLPMLIVWGLFLFVLFLSRPNSMRNSESNNLRKSNINRNFNPNHRGQDDDDNSAIS